MTDSEEIRLLREILKWTRFTSIRAAGDILTDALDSEQKRLIYHLSDGTRGGVEIAKAAGTSDRTVRRYWELWSRLGIVEGVNVRGGVRYKKAFELEDFGLEIGKEADALEADTAEQIGKG